MKFEFIKIKMKNRRSSEISDSEESEETKEAKNVFNSKSPQVNNASSSSGSSDSSSDSEQKRKNNSTLINKTRPSASPKKSVSSSPLKRFSEQNPGLQKVEIDDVISEDDEVCFLELPKTINPEEFLDKVINFNKKTKLKLNNIKYVIEPIADALKPLTIVTKSLRIIHPVTNLQLRENIKNKESSGIIDSVKYTPPLPDNLKIRHPLFGAEYEDKIVLDEEVQQKLDNTIDQFIKKMKKKKKHKEKIKNEEQEDIFTLLESHSREKKNKHKKQKMKEEPNQESAAASFELDIFEKEGEEENSFGKKKKHKKLKNNEESVMNEEVNEEESTFEKKKKKHKKEKNNKESVRNEEESTFEKKKKKHKKEKNNEESIRNEEKAINIIENIILPRVSSNQEAVSTEWDSFEKKKKHKKKKEEKNQDEKKKDRIVNSTIIPGLQLPAFEFDISSIMNKEEETKDDTRMKEKSFSELFDGDPSTKKKKKKHQSEESAEIDANEESTFEGHKKKKKKREKPLDEDSPPRKRKKSKNEEKREEATDALISNILSRVKSEMDSSEAKHKKRKKSDR